MSNDSNILRGTRLEKQTLKKKNEQDHNGAIPKMEISRIYPRFSSELAFIKLKAANPAFREFEDDVMVCSIAYNPDYSPEIGLHDGSIKIELVTKIECLKSLAPSLRKSFIQTIIKNLGFSSCHVVVNIEGDEADFYPADPEL